MQCLAMLRVASLLLSVICFTGQAADPTQATDPTGQAADPTGGRASGVGISLVQQGQTADPTRRELAADIAEKTQELSQMHRDAGQEATTFKDAVQEAADPAAVPEPVDVGADGFPKLPELSNILGSATSALKTVNSQASSLEARVAAAQKQITGKLVHQKAAFELQLKKQETQNMAVMAQNSKISSEISQLKIRNEDFRTRAYGLQKSNQVLRNEMHALGSKLGVARSFAFKSVFATDDSKEPTLNVLHMHEATLKQKQVVEAKDDDDDSADDSDSDEDEKVPENPSPAKKVTSLLQTAAHHEAATLLIESPVDEISTEGSPDDFLAQLTKDVAQLAAQEKKSEKTLRDIFIHHFRAGAQRHKALVAMQKSVTEERGKAQALEQRLQKAVAHLADTHLDLTRRLQGVAQFMKQLEHLAVAQETDVPKLIGKLPKAVTLGKRGKHVEQKLPQPLV